MLAGQDALPTVATSRCRVNPICVNMNVNDYNPGTKSKGQRLQTYTDLEVDRTRHECEVHALRDFLARCGCMGDLPT